MYKSASFKSLYMYFNFFRTNPQWEILFQKRMVESNQTKQEKIFMPDYGRFECVALTTYIVTLHGVFRVFHICRLAFSSQMLREIVSLVQNARCPYFSEERDKPSAYENVKNTPKLQHMDASFNLKFVCVRMWVH